MKKLFSFLLLVTLFATAFCQDGVLIDSRDQKSYGVTTINGLTWMTDNLDLKTSLSKGPEDIERELDPRLKGRWYHLNELESLCPEGWRLPTAHEWISYIDFLAMKKDGKYKVKTYAEDIQVKKFDKYLSLFEEGNPLNLISTGIFEGGKYRFPMGLQADYWIADLSTDASNEPYVKRVHENRSHIHLHDPFTQIHSHEHHLDTNDESTLRQFMVRCVCEEKSLN